MPCQILAFPEPSPKKYMVFFLFFDYRLFFSSTSSPHFLMMQPPSYNSSQNFYFKNLRKI